MPTLESNSKSKQVRACSFYDLKYKSVKRKKDFIMLKTLLKQQNFWLLVINVK